jgi:hypothetical protein
LFASLVLLMAAATKKKKRKEEAYPWRAGTSSRHITNLKQSILETFDVYGPCTNAENTNSRGRLGTVNLLIKVAGFTKK